MPNPTCANCGEQRPAHEASITGYVRIQDYEAARAEAEGSDVPHFDDDQVVGKTHTGLYLCRRCSLALTPEEASALMAGDERQ